MTKKTSSYKTPGKKDVENCPRAILTPLSPDAPEWRRLRRNRLLRALRSLAALGVRAAFRRFQAKGGE